MSLLQTRNNIRVRDGLKKKTTTFFPQMRYFEMPRDASGFYVNAMASDLCCVEMFNGVCLYHGVSCSMGLNPETNRAAR